VPCEPKGQLHHPIAIAVIERFKCAPIAIVDGVDELLVSAGIFGKRHARQSKARGTNIISPMTNQRAPRRTCSLSAPGNLCVEEMVGMW